MWVEIWACGQKYGRVGRDMGMWVEIWACEQKVEI